LQVGDTFVDALREGAKPAQPAQARLDADEQARVERIIADVSGLQRTASSDATELVGLQRGEHIKRKGETDAGVQPPRDDAERLLAELSGTWSKAERPDELGRLGGYRVLRLLGAGGMGGVFLAEDMQLQRHVALKVMRPHVAAMPGAAQRFLREARMAAAVKHEHVVTIYQVGEDHGVPFIAQELLDGETLDDRLKREGQLSIRDAVAIGQQIAAGLAAAHAKGLIHRDIKPANVWLECGVRNAECGMEEPATPIQHSELRGPNSAIGRVKLLDFGLARAFDDDSHLTQTGVTVGTPSYMAPEQASGNPVDARVDLFSLGVVLYRMTTGRLPFPGKSVLEVLRALANVTPPPARDANSDVPCDLSDLIDRLMRKDPQDRPSAARDVLRELADVVGSRREPTLSNTTATAPALAARRPPSRRWLIAMSSLLAVVLLGVIIITLRDKEGRETKITVAAPGGTKLVGVEQAESSESKVTEAHDQQSVKSTVPAPMPGVADYAVHLWAKQAIVVEGILGLSSDDPLTLELWVQPDDTVGTTTRHCILAQVSMMYLEPIQQGDRSVLISSLLEDAPGGVGKRTRGFGWIKGQRMHVAALSEHKRTSLYVDGKLIGMAEVDAPRPPTPVKVLRIGNETTDFSGIVDEVRLSRGVRYEKDFQPAARFEPDDDTLVLLHCDEGEGEWLHDASGRGNDGRINSYQQLPVRWVRADGSPNTEEPVNASNLVTLRRNGDSVDIAIGNELLTTYHTATELPKPYFSPVCSAGGTVITRALENPADYPWQKGVWCALDAVNGLRFWSELAKIENIRTELLVSEGNPAQLRIVNNWLGADGQPLVVETTLVSIYPNRLLAYDIQFAAGANPVTFGDTGEGLLGIRVADSMREKGGSGKVVNAEGLASAAQCWGKQSAWVDYSGSIDGQTHGVALFDHPDNPRRSRFHVRDYGLLSLSPFGDHKYTGGVEPANPLELKPGEAIRLRYGIYVHSGDTNAAEIPEVHEDYLKSASH
jgi:serine/threonine protein kinase